MQETGERHDCLAERMCGCAKESKCLLSRSLPPLICPMNVCFLAKRGTLQCLFKAVEVDDRR